MHTYLSLDSAHEPINRESIRSGTESIPPATLDRLLTLIAQKRSSATSRLHFATYSTEASYLPALRIAISLRLARFIAQRSRPSSGQASITIIGGNRS